MQGRQYDGRNPRNVCVCVYHGMVGSNAPGHLLPELLKIYPLFLSSANLILEERTTCVSVHILLGHHVDAITCVQWSPPNLVLQAMHQRRKQKGNCKPNKAIEDQIHAGSKVPILQRPSLLPAAKCPPPTYR